MSTVDEALSKIDYDTSPVEAFYLGADWQLERQVHAIGVAVRALESLKVGHECWCGAPNKEPVYHTYDCLLAKEALTKLKEIYEVR